MEDNKQTQTQTQEAQGWKDVVFTTDMPLNVLIHAMNVINQRVCQLEDIVKINYEGQTISVTEMIALEVAKEQQRLQEEQAKAQENKAE